MVNFAKGRCPYVVFADAHMLDRPGHNMSGAAPMKIMQLKKTVRPRDNRKDVRVRIKRQRT